MTQLQQSKQQQLALEIFDNFKIDGKSITESSVEIGYAKNNLFIDVSELGLVAKRALNACHYIATTTEPDENGMYTVKDDFFRFLINYDSNNLTHLKKSLREAQKSAAEINIFDGENGDKDKWASLPLLGATGLASGNVMFSIPTDIVKHVKNPSSFTFLSLRITASFTTSYAMDLYEITSSWLFKGGSDWMTIDEFRDLIGASKVKTLLDFRNLKRYVITPSLEQINKISNILVGYETKSTSGTKKITHIKFKVGHNKDGELNLQLGYKNQLSKVYEILTVEFGLSIENINEIMSERDKYTDNRIMEAIEFTRLRLSSKTGEEIKFPSLYLMNILRKGIVRSSIEVERANKAKLKRNEETPKKAKPTDPSKLVVKKKIEAFISALDEEEVSNLLAEYAESNKDNGFLYKSIKNQGLASKTVTMGFHKYILDNKLVD